MTDEELKQLEEQVAALEAEKRTRDEKAARRENAVKGPIVYSREDLARGNFDPAKIRSGEAVVAGAPVPATSPPSPVTSELTKYTRADLLRGNFDPAKLRAGLAIVEG